MNVTADSLVRFVYEEARLIDDKKFNDWYALFAEDGFYWVPLTRGQPDGLNHTSLLYEDKLLLKVRIERLQTARPFTQQQPSFCQHILQVPTVEANDPEAGRYVTRTAFMYIESQLDEQIVLAGVATHHLVALDGTLRIVLKKVELVNCDAALPSIQLFP
jgi:3-phenylpropionate/cinnamic acid dioxygenase small subunit